MFILNSSMNRSLFYLRALVLVLIFVTLQGCASLGLISKKNNVIETYIDLNEIENDQLQVSLDPGPFPEGEVIFHMPSVIPGTYRFTDFGRFISNFKAFDKNNQLLDVVREGKNTWKIANGKQLDRISYLVDDTFDSDDGRNIYPMGGTKIEKDKVFLLNLHGFVGYFEGGKEWSYRVTINSPADLVPFSSMKTLSHTATKDVFLAKRYFNIIDDPIMYSQDDSISFQLEDIDVNLAVYSPRAVHKAADFKETLEKMMRAQKRFLGPANNTKRYDILLMLMNSEELEHFGGIQGALEHHTSTTVVFFEDNTKELLKKYLTDVVSHEFFHTLTPLNVHSEQIHYFNYKEGVMSKHLWMYEGTTEYFANLFQVQQGLVDDENFYKRMLDKIIRAKEFDDTMPFTSMSTNIVEEPYQSNYQNVYFKGALINMCLDIIIREQSGGERGLLSVMQALAKKYGVDTPFRDNQLFDEIVAMTYPEVDDFIQTYVQGETPIPYNIFLEKAGLGISSVDEEMQSILLFDSRTPSIETELNEAGGIDLIVKGLNNRLAEIGFLKGDVIRVFNGTDLSEISKENMDMVNNLFNMSFSWMPEQEVSFEVDRKGKQRVVLSGKVGVAVAEAKGIVAKQNAKPAQIALRNSWLLGN
jgi:predicted metalloprotease with PDZ domain